MGKEVREISRFYVAPPRELVLSVWRVSRSSLPKNLHPLVEANQSILGIASFLFWSRWLAGSVVRPTSNYCILTPVAVTVEVDWTTERTTTTANGRSKSESTGAFYLDTPTYVRSTLDPGFLEGDSRVSVSCLLDNSKWCSAGFLI